MMLIILTGSASLLGESGLSSELIQQRARDANTGVLSAQLRDDVFATRDIDVVYDYFNSIGGPAGLALELRDLPDSEFRNKIYLMLFERDWPFSADNVALRLPIPEIPTACILFLNATLNESLDIKDQEILVSFYNRETRKQYVDRLKDALRTK